MADPCDLPLAKDTALCKAAGAVKSVIDFAQDPLGYIAQKMQEAADGLATTVLPAMEKLTHPDLSKDWFVSAYRISFALAVLVWVGFLAWNFVQLSRRRISSDDLVESLAVYTPAFFVGSIFGPLAGTTLLALTGALTDSLVTWGVAGSVKTTTTALQDAIKAGDQAKIAGGSIVAILIFFCLIVALIMVFVVLLIMEVTLYLAGAVFPLSVVWLVQPRQRSKGLRVGMVWIGVCCAHVLIFLLLGVAFQMIGGLGTSFDDPGLQILANLFVAVIALVMATTAPFGLLAFAPVGASSAPVSEPFPPGGGGAPTGGGYDAAEGDSQAAQMARDDGGQDADDEDGTGDGAAGGGGGGGALAGVLSADGGGGQTSSAAMESGAEGSSGTGSALGTAGGSQAADAGAGPDAMTGGGGPMSGADAGAGTASGEDSGGTGGGEGDALIAAGGAGAATGVGAAVGVGMQAVGGALNAAGAAAQLAQSAGETAAEQMEHAETYDERGSGADTNSRR